MLLTLKSGHDPENICTVITSLEIKYSDELDKELMIVALLRITGSPYGTTLTREQ